MVCSSWIWCAHGRHAAAITASSSARSASTASSSYAITADIYSHVAPAQQREAADKLGQAIHW
jgi:hypothetical protein